MIRGPKPTKACAMRYKINDAASSLSATKGISHAGLYLYDQVPISLDEMRSHRSSTLSSMPTY
ncbi:hypothetical protein N7520_001463 [Penicillium odoratum]|uniref:uncharacterized protein n=1 Tax=Penicillium odoratum TaxID=1167516 RepID=UPI002549245B|nr:uncharacterized protein N7520_001463 [Penicillium odoratum]KAJ5778217.1 hypothetical protein N7520_001463 [Penicillium odoratum]